MPSLSASGPFTGYTTRTCRPDMAADPGGNGSNARKILRHRAKRSLIAVRDHATHSVFSSRACPTPNRTVAPTFPILLRPYLHALLFPLDNSTSHRANSIL